MGMRVACSPTKMITDVIYTATISSTPLRLRESRLVADLLLRGLHGDDWKHALVDENILQSGSAIGVVRSANIIRARLEPLGADLWTMVRDGDQHLATQAAFAGAVRHSRLLGDFMDITLREQRALFADHLEPRMWGEYLEGCRGRDPEMPFWSEATVAKLRSIVFSMLAEAGYLRDTRSLKVQNVFLEDALAALLRERSERYVLRCMEVHS